MIVFAAGMRRAGSTVVFNITKELVETIGGRALRLQEHTIDQILQHTESRQLVVVKAHALHKQLVPFVENSFVLMSVRDIREVCGSVMRLMHLNFNDVINKNLLGGYISEQQTWNAVSIKYFRRYEDWVGNLQMETLSIASYLQLDVSRETCKDIAEKWSIRNVQEHLKTVAGTHFETLFGPKHITSTFEQTENGLSQEQIDILNSKYGWWLEENGYAC